MTAAEDWKRGVKDGIVAAVWMERPATSRNDEEASLEPMLVSQKHIVASQEHGLASREHGLASREHGLASREHGLP